MKPVLFEFGPFTVGQYMLGPFELRSYGLMLLVAFTAALAWGIWERKRLKLTVDQVLDWAIYLMIFGLVGARLVYVGLNWHEYRGNLLDIAKLWEGGLSYHGAFAGGLLAAIIFSWRRKIAFWRLLDFSAPPAALAYGIGRIGCLLNGCCGGGPCDLPWAVTYSDPSLGPLFGEAVPRHPTQAYASIGSLLIFGLLVWTRRRFKMPGALFGMWVLLSSALRFGVEFFRRDYSAVVTPLGNLTQAQWASIVIFAITVVVMVVMKRQSRARVSAPVVPAGETGGS